MFRLDYISCVLTISAAILLGQKRWQGWLIAGINSILVCDIALHTAQTGFIPANVFCIALYAYNILGWRRQIKARRELDELSRSVDARAALEAVEIQGDSAQRSQKKEEDLMPRLCLLDLPSETHCCERSAPSFRDSNELNKHLDLENLWSRSGNPQMAGCP